VGNGTKVGGSPERRSGVMTRWPELVHNVCVKFAEWDPATVRLSGWPGVPIGWRLKREKQAPVLVRLWATLPVVATYAYVWQYNHGYIAGYGFDPDGGASGHQLETLG
jgi:hypothetical protein